MLGILLYDRFPVGSIYIYNALSLSVITLVFSLFQFHKIKNFAVVIFFFVLGVFLHYLNSEKPKFEDFNGKQKVIFQLNKKLNSNEKNRRYEISVLKIDTSTPLSVREMNLPLNAVISVPRNEPQLDFKNYYQSEIYLNRVESTTNDFQFDYAKYLSRKDIYYQSFISDKLVFIPKKSLTFSEKIKQQRLDVLQNIDESSLQPKNKEFLKGIILADRTEMDAETVSDFNKSGLVHLLAISGSHMVIIFWLIMLILKRIIPPKFKNLSILISLLLIWLFAVFIDYGSSVVRSCIMITAYYIFVLLQRKSDLLHAMALAGFTILIFDTNQIHDVGFQLSFLAVLGIYWLNQPILKYLSKPKNDFQNFLVNVPSVSLSAQLATLPLVIYYFHQYSLISIFANIFIIPFSEIIIISSILMTVLFAFKIDFGLLNLIYDGLVSVLLSSIKWFASQDFVFSKNIPMTFVEALILLFAFYFLRKILLKKDLKSTINFGALMLVFFTVRMGFNVYNYQKNEVLMTNYFKEKVLISKTKNKVIFYVKEKVNKEKIEKFVVESYLNSRRISHYKIVTLSNDLKAVRIGKNTYEME